MSERKLCLFDWNGTLQDDLHHIYECGVQRIFRHFGLSCPTIDEYRHEVTADFMSSFYWPHGIPRDVSASDLNAIMGEGFKEKGTPAGIFPDAHEAVKAVRDRGFAIMVVSGYDESKLRAAVERSGLAPYFTHVRGDVRDKPAALRDCLALFGRTPERLIKVGDTVEDALAAHEVGATPYICPRGFHPRERIEAVRERAPALVIIDTLGDLPALLDTP